MKERVNEGTLPICDLWGLPFRASVQQTQVLRQGVLSQGLKTLIAGSSAPQPCNQSSHAAHFKPSIKLNTFYIRARRKFFFWSHRYKSLCEEATRRLIDTSKWMSSLSRGSGSIFFPSWLWTLVISIVSSAASPDRLSLLQHLSGEMMALGRRQTLEVILWDGGGDAGKEANYPFITRDWTPIPRGLGWPCLRRAGSGTPRYFTPRSVTLRAACTSWMSASITAGF